MRKIDWLIMSAPFHGRSAEQSASEACKWINGKSPKESMLSRVVSITTVPYESVYMTIVFYRSK